MRKDMRKDVKRKKIKQKKKRKIMRKELGLKEKRIKRREREVDGGNKKKKRKESEHVVYCIVFIALSIVLTVNFIRRFPYSSTAGEDVMKMHPYP